MTSASDNDDTIFKIAELRPRHGSTIRIPPQTNVAITDRVRRLLDAPAMKRLTGISQLGMVSLVYPGATHNRFEHSIGVYQQAVTLVDQLINHDFFQRHVTPRNIESFLVAALLHDVGHWPFCHPVEDMGLDGLPRHEQLARQSLAQQSIASALAEDWLCDADDVMRLLSPGGDATMDPGEQFFASCLSGPVDVDKMDYLQRDSLHAGVPYGRHFDADRLIGSMTVHPDRPGLAVGEKGKTAAEMMVFARYVMFSEVYWHRTVRAATAMLQRSVFVCRDEIDLAGSLTLDDNRWIARLRDVCRGGVAESIAEGLFGPSRRLYKTVLQCAAGGDERSDHHARMHHRLVRRPYWYLVAAAESLAAELGRHLSIEISPIDVIIDAPPVKLEVDINMDIIGRDGIVRRLGEVSPVAAALANRQFDDQVKKLRVFVRGDLRAAIEQRVAPEQWSSMITRVTDALDRDLV